MILTVTLSIIVLLAVVESDVDKDGIFVYDVERSPYVGEASSELLDV